MTEQTKDDDDDNNNKNNNMQSTKHKASQFTLQKTKVANVETLMNSESESSVNDENPQKGREFFLFCRHTFPPYIQPCLAPSRYLVNIY